jgi:phospholipid/cholesterol/gamma-HCH transport system ATP-binding protein
MSNGAGKPIIEYIDIHKAFDVPVLRGVSLTVEEGEMFALFGPSGTGKSVLLKTTMGLIDPDRGDVRVAGESVFYGGPRVLSRIRKLAGYVFQNAALFDSLNVLENVRMGIPEEELVTLGQDESARRVWDALEHVNLDPTVVLGKLPAELSGGMRKRVGIARAIVGRPRIMLWDEPTTGLDPVNTAAVERLIVGLSREMETTALIVTHDIQSGLAMCDRVAMLEGGRIRFSGTPSEFRANPDPVVQAFVDRGAAEAALDLAGDPSGVS